MWAEPKIFVNYSAHNIFLMKLSYLSNNFSSNQSSTSTMSNTYVPPHLRGQQGTNSVPPLPPSLVSAPTFHYSGNNDVNSGSNNNYQSPPPPPSHNNDFNSNGGGGYNNNRGYNNNGGGYNNNRGGYNNNNNRNYNNNNRGGYNNNNGGNNNNNTQGQRPSSSMFDNAYTNNNSSIAAIANPSTGSSTNAPTDLYSPIVTSTSSTNYSNDQPPPVPYNNNNYGSSSNSNDGGYNNNRNFNGGGYNNRGYNNNGGGGGYNNRGYNNNGGGYNNRGYNNRGGYNNRDYTNELGFHGSLREDRNLEQELFGSGHSTGINFDKYDDIPVDASDGCPPPLDSFNEEMLGSGLMANTKRAGFTRPTPVQKYSIPIGFLGRDLMACAQTGSGKTGGFLFPVIAQMLKNGAESPPEGARSNTSYPNCLILAPTRELAVQIFDEARKFTYRTGIRAVVVYGGAEVGPQLRDLDRGCDILVGTPGRLMDLIERGKVSLSCCRHLVLDEADRMLDMGFEPQIRKIVQNSDMPPVGSEEGRQTFMFSATFPKEIQRLANDFLYDYIFLSVGRVGQAAQDISQSVEYVESREKPATLIKHLQGIQDGLILVFVQTKVSADTLEYKLTEQGFPATSIHGDRTQREREEALELFKRGECPILVATDVASRGLDISGVTHVFNYDMPNTIDDYVHRIGRTGRVGNTGTAVSFMNDENRTIATELANLLDENGHTVPTWLETMAGYGNYGGGGNRRGRGRGRGGPAFGGRDYRKDNGNRNYNSSSSNNNNYGNSGNNKPQGNNNYNNNKPQGNSNNRSQPSQNPSTWRDFGVGFSGSSSKPGASTDIDGSAW